MKTVTIKISDSDYQAMKECIQKASLGRPMVAVRELMREHDDLLEALLAVRAFLFSDACPLTVFDAIRPIGVKIDAALVKALSSEDLHESLGLSAATLGYRRAAIAKATGEDTT